MFFKPIANVIYAYVYGCAGLTVLPHPLRRQESPTRMELSADRELRSKSLLNDDYSKHKLKSMRLVYRSHNFQKCVIVLICLASLYIGRRHYEDERRKGAGKRSEAVRAGRSGRCSTAGCFAVRTASRKVKEEILVAKLEGLWWAVFLLCVKNNISLLTSRWWSSWA